MADNNNGINSVMESLLKGANALMSTKTVVGEAPWLWLRRSWAAVSVR